MIEHAVKSSSVILFLVVSGDLSLLLITPYCGWLMAQIWHRFFSPSNLEGANVMLRNKERSAAASDEIPTFDDILLLSQASNAARDVLHPTQTEWHFNCIEHPGKETMK